ncbi:MAG: DUF2520 domain-containing protein [Acidobacteriota bacterium]|nr:DUF2520 domain-containing protein [Acidobacteriota bacterium]
MQYALVGAGSVGKSFLAQLPRLTQQLGPVAAASPRLASRIANTLGAGVPVKSMDALDSAKLILICVSTDSFDKVVGELSRADITWERKILLLCDSNLYSNSLPDFRMRGAFTGSINPLADVSKRFIVEGQPAAVRAAKHLVSELSGRAIALNADRMWSYHAALTFSSGLFTPLIESCVESLHSAGAPGVIAVRIAEGLFQRSLRSYMHAGRKSWSGSLAHGDEGAIESEIEELRGFAPLLAEYYRASAVFALEFFKRHPDLASRLKRQNVP